MTLYQEPSPDATGALSRFPIAEMKQRHQWIGFKLFPNGKGKPKKIPVLCTAPSELASSTAPQTWGAFDAAVTGLAAGNYTAIGYALDGDIVGIDLDGERWVVGDDELSEEAQTIVERCGSYAEWSISRQGIHILLHGQLPGAGRRNDKAGAEIYNRKRFFIVTGRQLDGTPATISENQRAIEWLLAYLFDIQGNAIQPTELPEITEDMTSGDSGNSGDSGISVHSVGPIASVEQIIAQTLPTKQGQRNDHVRRLARGLKFDAGMGKADFAQLKPIVRGWHAKALPVIGTQNFDETWSDFVRAFKGARIPLNFDAVGWAMDKAKAEPLPAATSEYDSEPVKLLVGVCWHLGSLDGQRRFFLSSHQAGARLGVSHDTVLRWLAMLCADRVIERLKPGNEYQATRYRYIHRNGEKERA